MAQKNVIKTMVAAGAVLGLFSPVLLNASVTAPPSRATPPTISTPANTTSQPGPTGSTAPAPSSAAASQQTVSDPNKVVCRRVQLTGSRVRAPRVCRTQAEWDAAAVAASSTAKNMQSTGIGVPPGGQ
jgi:hypothetical protein